MKMNFVGKLFSSAALLAAMAPPMIPVSASAQAAPAAGERVTATFSDASRPGTLRVSLMSGGVSVRGHAGKEVIIEAAPRERAAAAEARGGMTRLTPTASGLTVEEENNVMRVSLDAWRRPVDLNIQVPRRTSLVLKTMNNGGVEVTGVEGDLEVRGMNGPVTLNQVAGTVVADSMNGKVLVTLTRADSKPMAFSSFNGDVDVSFPADFKANVVMSSEMGDIYSDFEVKTAATAQPVAEDNRAKGGKYRVKFDKTIRGAISGGGPEIRFKTHNGNIYIRKTAAR